MNSNQNYSKLIEEIQSALQTEHIDGWLFYNFRESNMLATRILDLPKQLMFTRRFFYYIPAIGIPRK